MGVVLVGFTYSISASDAYPFDNEKGYLSPASEVQAWYDSIERSRQQNLALADCWNDKEACPRHLRSLVVILNRGADLQDDQKVKVVNRYINRFKRYKKDRRQELDTDHGRVVSHHEWVTLSEFLKSGGDCEDYASSKYHILKKLGFDASDMRIVVVYDRIEREFHALLAVRYQDGTSVLLDTDNRSYKRKPSRFKFIYAMNEDAVWDHDIASARLARNVLRAIR